MIVLIAASAVSLIASQAVIAAPTIAYKDCLKQTSVQAKKEKVGGDAYEAYVRNACNAQITALRDALIAFEVKNGTKRKDAATDADLTVDDYLASSVDNYQFLAGVAADNAKQEADARAKAAAAATPAATPAAAPQQPPPK
jgi:hypothetical protein